MPRQKISKQERLDAANAYHEKWMAKKGLFVKKKTKKQLSGVGFPDYSIDKRDLKPSNVIPGGVAAKRDIQTDHLWKTGQTETSRVIEEIHNKANRIGPAYNKGGMQYLTEGHDFTKDGRRKT